MGLWYATVPLRAGETARLQVAGNFFQDRRQLGGRVSVTDQRFLYAPSRLAGLFGATPISIELTDLTALQLAKPGKAAVRARGAGAMRRPQVEISADGHTRAFSVRDYDGLMKAISEARPH